MKKLSKYQQKLFELILGGVTYSIVMFLGVYTASAMLSSPEKNNGLLLMFSLLVMSLVFVYRFFCLHNQTKLSKIRNAVLFVFYIALAILAAVGGTDSSISRILAILFGVLIIVSSIISTVINHSVRSIILNIFASIYGTLFILVFSVVANEVELSILLSFVPATYVVISFFYAMSLIFSGLRKQTLVQIIKKTYAIEILYGLITLIIVTSIMLMMTEDAFANFGDALWYCFAVVTTIGFGDIVAVTVVGRILTVILGIYGLIVVALITSIIVNFYNESSPSKEERIKEIIENLEEERKTKEEKEDKE